MFGWRKNCVKDISKDVAGKGPSMNKKERIRNPLLSLVLILSWKYKTKGSRKIVTGWGSDTKSLGL